jgi:hypothetical protein
VPYIYPSYSYCLSYSDDDMRINIYIEQYKCIVRCVHVYYDQDILVSFLVPLSSFEEGY